MKTRITRILFIVGILLTAQSQAARFAGVVGARTNAASSLSTTDVADGKPSWQAGALIYFPLFWDFKLRSGFLYQTKSYTLQNSGSTQYDFSYIEIPASLVLTISPQVFAFAGGGYLTNVERSCSRPSSGVCSTSGTKSSLVEYHFGIGSQIWSRLGAEVYYELVPGQIQNNNGAGFKDGSSVAGHLMFMF